MSRDLRGCRSAPWLALVLVFTLIGTPFIGAAQVSTATGDPVGLDAKITAGSNAMAGAATPGAVDTGRRPQKSDTGPAASDSQQQLVADVSQQLLTDVNQALTAADLAAKAKTGRLTKDQQQQLTSLKEAHQGEADFRVRLNSKAGTPKMIKLAAAKAPTGLRTLTLGDGAATARSFLRDQKTLLGLEDPDAELAIKRQWLGPLGNRHFRYQQEVAGLPVWGREALVHVDGSDAVYLYQGDTVKSTAKTTGQTAQIDVAEALVFAQAHLGEGAIASTDSEDRLVYYPESKDDLVLCYQVGVERGLAERWWYFIDADNGDVVHRVSRVADVVVSASGTSLLGNTRSFNAWSAGGSYYLVDPSIPLDDSPGDPVGSVSSKGNLYVFDARNGEGDLFYITSNSATSGWDQAGVSAMYNVGLVHNYYQNTHDRSGIDGDGMNYQAVVHLKQNYANAFWNGTFIVFGDGDNQTFSNLAASLDIMAHEIQHGVTQFTAGLIYENQSGALNEAYSDIFACMVDRDDWTVGEDVTLAGNGFLRDLANPERGLTPLPTKMSEYRNMPVDEDHGGVHINMSIPSRAAYFIAAGLDTNIGRDKTEQIFFRALTTYLTASSNFADGRSATLQAAEDLYGAGSAEVTAVGAGWDAVEIYADGGSTPDDPNPKPGDPVSGNDLMVYLRPVDGSHNSGSENFDVHVQSLPSPFSDYSPSQDSSDLNPSVYAHYTKPAAYSAGNDTLVLYVGSDRNLYAVYADGTGHEKLTNFDKSEGDDGIWSIALSPDGRYFAFTSDSGSDNNIYVGDLQTLETTPFPLVSSSTEHPGDSAGLNTIFYADALAFDYTSSRIVFDALNCVSSPDSDCSETDGGYRYWSIGIIDLNDGSIFYPFPNQNPDYDIGFPAFAANNDYVIALDETDRTQENVDGTYTATVWTYNWRDGTSNAIANPNVGSNDRVVYGVPSFWGDDDYLTILGHNDTNASAYRVPIDSNWAGNPSAAEQLNDNDVAMPLMHRTGTRNIASDLSLSSSSLEFGSVSPGGSTTLDLTLSNSGARDIEITSITSSSTYFTHNGVNTRLPRGQNMTITVTYLAPSGGGSQTGTLTITSDADTVSRNIALQGQSGSGGDGDGDGDGDGGASSEGGCFLMSLGGTPY